MLHRVLVLAATLLTKLPSVEPTNALEYGATSSFVRGCCIGKHISVGMYHGEFSPMWRFTGNVSDWQWVPPGDGRLPCT